MRNAFIDELVSLAQVHPQIALVVGDLGYSVVEPFADRFPDRFVNAGVAEQNMTGLAAGMASEGYHVFTYSIANFPSFRCAEQIRNDIDYHNLPVTVVAVGGGLAYGALGYSHHAVQDYALFRSFPNTLIAAPGDPMEVRACLRYLVHNPQPSYIRLGKAGEKSFHATVPDVQPGQWLHIASNENKTSSIMLSTGATLEMAMEGLKINKYDAVYTLPLWSMATKNIQIAQVNPWQVVNTIEDHLLDGGMASWMQEALACKPELRLRVRSMGLDSKVCGTVGSQVTLNQLGGINF